MKKLLSIGLIMVLLISMCGTVVAKESINFDTQSSNVFLAYGSGISVRSGYAECTAFSDLVNFYDTSMTMELQKDNGGWQTIKTWYNSGYTASLNIYGTYAIGSGTYRVKTTHKAGGEPKVSYSDNLYY